MELYFLLSAITLYLIAVCRGTEVDLLNIDIAQELTDQYNANSKTKCVDHDGSVLPVYGCNGLIIRGRPKLITINDNPTEHVWSHNRSNSISAGFLRQDSTFPKLGRGFYESGLILYPPTKTPKEMTRCTAYCAFPVDGWTDYRLQDRGCTGTKQSHMFDILKTSKFCHQLHIDTLDDWILHFEDVRTQSPFGSSQCAFDMTGKDAYEAFNLVLRAQVVARRNKNYAEISNEIVLAPWDNDLRKIPIQAFYYVKGSQSGLIEAIWYQNDYFDFADIIVPIVCIRFPSSRAGISIVHYKENEEALKVRLLQKQQLRKSQQVGLGTKIGKAFESLIKIMKDTIFRRKY